MATDHSHLCNGPKWVGEWAQGPGIGAKGADAGEGVGGQSPPPPFKYYYGHPKGPGAQGP